MVTRKKKTFKTVEKRQTAKRESNISSRLAPRPLPTLVINRLHGVRHCFSHRPRASFFNPVQMSWAAFFFSFQLTHARVRLTRVSCQPRRFIVLHQSIPLRIDRSVLFPPRTLTVQIMYRKGKKMIGGYAENVARNRTVDGKETVIGERPGAGCFFFKFFFNLVRNGTHGQRRPMVVVVVVVVTRRREALATNPW